MTYKIVPVDEETYAMLTDLIAANGMPKRSYGAIVKKLTKPEHEKLAESEGGGYEQKTKTRSINTQDK